MQRYILSLSLSLSLSPSLSLSLSHTHTHTHKHSLSLSLPEISDFYLTSFVFAISLGYGNEQCRRKPEKTGWRAAAVGHTSFLFFFTVSTNSGSVGTPFKLTTSTHLRGLKKPIVCFRATPATRKRVSTRLITCHFAFHHHVFFFVRLFQR